MLDALAIQHAAQHLAGFDGDGADQNRSPSLAHRGNFVHNGFELGFFGLKHQIGVIQAPIKLAPTFRVGKHGYGRAIHKFIFLFDQLLLRCAELDIRRQRHYV